MYVWVLCLHVCLCTVCRLSAYVKSKIGGWNLWYWMYKWLWTAIWTFAIEPRFLGRIAMLLMTEPSFSKSFTMFHLFFFSPCEIDYSLTEIVFFSYIIFWLQFLLSQFSLSPSHFSTRSNPYPFFSLIRIQTSIQKLKWNKAKMRTNKPE